MDPETLDRVFTVHAEEHAPITLRVDPVQLETILANLVRVVARSLN